MSRKPRTKEWEAFVAHLSACGLCAKVGRCGVGTWLLEKAQKSADPFQRKRTDAQTAEATQANVSDSVSLEKPADKSQPN